MIKCKQGHLEEASIALLLQIKPKRINEALKDEPWVKK